MTTSGNRVIVADDHPLIGVALRLSVQAVDPTVDVVEVGTFAALQQAMSRAQTVRLVLLDLLLPDVEGLAGLRFLHAHHPQARVAVVSAVQDPLWVRLAEASGAVAFVPKSTDAKSLHDIFRRLLDGGSWWPETLPPARGGGIDKRLERLSPQELRILLQIKEGRLNKQIAFDLDISESTVKAHVSNLLLKLDLRSRTQAAVLAQKLLAWRPPGPSEAPTEDSLTR